MSTTNNTLYDLIIVGAGPAGASAALYAQRHGMKTLLLDKDRFPRDKICGDALSGKSVSILHELGLLEEVSRLPGALINEVVFGSPDHTDVHIDLQRYDHRDLLTGKVMPMQGYVIRRQIFDHFLFKKARQVAAETIEGFTVRELIKENGVVQGVKGHIEGCEAQVEYRGRVVLGCDGFNSIVARKTGLYEHESQHWVVALRCYYKNVADLTDQIELHFVDEVLPGYFWIFPLENGCANVGIGMLHEYIKKRSVNLKQALDEVIARPPFAARFAQAQPLEEPVGWNLPVGSKRRRSYGDGFMLLGDAAGLIDPFTGEGIGNALYSARCAVETAKAAIQLGDTRAAVLKGYEDTLWEAIGDELKISTRLQQMGRWRPLLNFTLHKAARNPKISDLVCGMIANAVPKKELTSPLFYLKLLLR
jgi:geranylgeranyl reductase family protein